MGICPYRSDLSKGIAIAPPGDSAPTYYAIALVMNPQASRPGLSGRPCGRRVADLRIGEAAKHRLAFKLIRHREEP